MRTTASRLFTFVNIWNWKEFQICEKIFFSFGFIWEQTYSKQSITQWSDTYSVAQLYHLYIYQTTSWIVLREKLFWFNPMNKPMFNHFQFTKKKKKHFHFQTFNLNVFFFLRPIGGLRNTLTNNSSEKQSSSVSMLCSSSPLPRPCTQFCGSPHSIMSPPHPSTPMTWTPYGQNWTGLIIVFGPYSGPSQMSAEYINEIATNPKLVENGQKKENARKRRPFRSGEFLSFAQLCDDAISEWGSRA